MFNAATNNPEPRKCGINTQACESFAAGDVIGLSNNSGYRPVGLSDGKQQKGAGAKFAAHHNRTSAHALNTFTLDRVENMSELSVVAEVVMLPFKAK